MGKTQRQWHRRQRKRWEGWTDGEIRKAAGSPRCSSCDETLPAERFATNRGRANGLNNTCRDCTAFRSARIRARKKGIEFDDDLERSVGPAPAECPCCGTPMERGGDTLTSPSLDRLVPELGYTAGNVVWLCARCNTIKSNAGPAELYRLADWLWNEYKVRGYPLPATRLRPHNTKENESE